MRVRLASIKAFLPPRERRLAVLAVLAALGGCSMPIHGLIDRAPTGAIRSATYPFAEEDWPKVEPALRAAIRAEAGDDPAAWTSEASGRRGAVVGVGTSFAKAGATCRGFVARIRDGEQGQAVQGSACEKDGAVTLSDIGPFKG